MLALVAAVSPAASARCRCRDESEDRESDQQVRRVATQFRHAEAGGPEVEDLPKPEQAGEADDAHDSR